MSIEDVQAFDDYEFMDVGNYKPLRTPLVTVSREAWEDMSAYISRLEEENKSLKAQLSEADEYVCELEDKLNAANS